MVVGGWNGWGIKVLNTLEAWRRSAFIKIIIRVKSEIVNKGPSSSCWLGVTAEKYANITSRPPT